jgi:four helix bundle suffix protein
VATIVYDATVSFFKPFVDARSRTVDQMVQAARCGRQNIAEGSRAAVTSSQTELRLVNVARASLDKLLLDYEDFLRQRGLPAWIKDTPEAKKVRSAWQKQKRDDRTVPSDQSDPSDPTDHASIYDHWLESADPAIVANTLICLIHQCNYLLDLQITALERQFVTEGGYSERLAAKRIAHRAAQSTPSTAPDCPQCGKPMALRTAKKGKNAGSQFWGCFAYPDCKDVRKLAVNKKYRPNFSDQTILHQTVYFFLFCQPFSLQ